MCKQGVCKQEHGVCVSRGCVQISEPTDHLSFHAAYKETVVESHTPVMGDSYRKSHFRLEINW